MAAPVQVITVTMNTAIDRVLRVPGFAVGAHLPAEPISDTPAGKGVNVSRALARLGRSSTATGFVGEPDAERFKAITIEDGSEGRIDNQLIPVPGRTRENVTIVDPDTGNDTHLRMQGFTVTGDDLARLGAVVGRLSRAGVVMVFAGSLPAGMDAHALIELVRRAKAGGAQVALDLDGVVLGGVLDAAGGVWLVSPNRSELAEALGKRGELSDAELLPAARDLGTRAQRVLLSLGAQGAMLLTPDGAWRGACPVDRGLVVSTVGAGDCLLAAVVDGCLSGMTPDETLRRGVAVASASIRNAEPVGFDHEVVRELARTAVVKPLVVSR